MPDLTLMRADALREASSALRYVVKTGCQWRTLPNDPPDWMVASQQARWRFEAGVFEAAAHDPRVILRLVPGRDPQPSAVILDGSTLQSTPGSGGRGGYDGAKKKNGSKVPVAADTTGN